MAWPRQPRQLESDYTEATSVVPANNMRVLNCNWRREERPQTGKITLTNSILHDTDGTALYINQSVELAILDGGAVDAEIERLSRRFQERACVTRVTAKNGLPAAVIAQWGQVRLEPLDQENIRAWLPDESRETASSSTSSRISKNPPGEGLPVFRIGGGPGYIWSARYDRSKKERWVVFCARCLQAECPSGA